ncbi:MAG: hypothetical protein A2W90_14325 [Bacteroidetes bacterium GWF2_42_66]|nr:MAG: hypothetical protein A2W92_20245 [Bacteroidetes bacterium GWA2_42_15]OFX96696.1 MAG: hypothetical protein A2W89_04715 [Bacteroidetes bacterium GWE2_42_39]OFY45399.1 MAG: hypothetical protein A2W90_14325 [Bacteroidetes bacterium GWF2_42_66]HBL73677.1 hypothetical protein [Prolixibacteraceae bacterium]HCR92182.1 hypothetical protein [Prolixibacteraceae bacterium]
MKRNLITTAFLILSIFANCQKEEEKTLAETSMKVKNYEGHIHIGFFAEDKNMEISFYSCGVNQLFGIAKVRYFSNLTDHHQNRTSNEFNSATDWIGPYFVCGEENIQSGLQKRFTGGWHGSNGDGTGTPTASTNDVTILVDGETINGNMEQNAQQVDLFVTNFIQGYDFPVSNKNLLKETIHYQVTDNRKIDVSVTIEALYDLRIQRYYGLQSQNFAIFDLVKYAANQQVINTEAIETNSRCLSNAEINTIVLSDRENQYQLKLVLNTAEGLGTFTCLGDGLPKAFSASYRKSYFNLVNGKELVMKKGEQVFWKGSYTK